MAREQEKAGDAQRIGMETGPTAGVLFRAIQTTHLPVVRLETRKAFDHRLWLGWHPSFESNATIFLKNANAGFGE